MSNEEMDRKTVLHALHHTIKLLETHGIITLSCNDYFLTMLESAADLMESDKRLIDNQARIINGLGEKLKEQKSEIELKDKLIRELQNLISIGTKMMNGNEA